MASMIETGALGFGIQLPIQSKSHTFAEPWEDAAGIDELSAIARACDRARFLYVGVCDHTAIPEAAADHLTTEWWETTTTLGYLAGITEHVRLLSHVYVLPHRHPLMTAKAFLTLDAVSRGRAVLGVGAGHLEAEFEVLGTDFASRGAVTDEAIDVVRAAFTDEFVHHDGERLTIPGAGLRPRPAQAGGPPIWVGGSTPRALRRAAEKGDGWLPQGPPKQGMKDAIAWMLERRAEVRPDAPFDIGAFTGPVYVGEPGFEVEPYCITGPPGKVASIIRKITVPGVNHVQVRFRSRSHTELIDQIDAFASDVMPLVAATES